MGVPSFPHDRDPLIGGTVAELRGIIDTLHATTMASAAASAPVTGAAAPAGITFHAVGPEVHISQAPPMVSVTVNQYVTGMASTPADAANVVGREVGNAASRALTDNVNE